MKKLTKKQHQSNLLSKYFELQEERFRIENDKKHWPAGWDYSDMVNRVNEISPLVRRIAIQLEALKG